MTSCVRFARIVAPLPVLTLLAGLVAAGCTEPRPATAIAPSGMEVRLSLSKPDPRVGDTIVASIRASGEGSLALASLTGRIDFDSTRVRFVGERAVQGTSSAVNPSASSVKVASVALEGFGAGDVIALRFAVVGPSASLALRLAVDELHSITMRDLKPTAAIVASPARVP
jgi:hypothetical protein